jgi:hypothetical protein
MSGADYEAICVNHVAFSVSRDELDDKGRARIVEFFTGCLDFAHDTASKNVRMVHRRPGQDRRAFGSTYVVFIGREKPATGNPGRGGDHFGISCSTLEQYNSYLDRTRKYLEKYGILENIDARPEEPGLYGFYVQPFDAPISIEVQYLDGGAS